MAAIGIATNIASQFESLIPQSKSQKLKQGFQQLAQDLQFGNLSQAQSDFSSLQQLLPGGPQNSLLAPTSATQSSNPLATAVSQLAKDLQSGNLGAAQSDLSTVQQDAQQVGQQQGPGHAHHHHHHGAGSDPSQQNPISTLFGQLGQDLQAGNLSAAQQAYATLQQGFEQFAPSSSGATSNTSANANLSVSA